MHKLSFHETSPAGRLFSSLTMTALAVLVALECAGATAWAQTAEKRTDPATRPEFREPVTLTSKDGVLEVRLTARQGQASLDTVATPVQNFLLFDYELIRGTASNGRKSGGNLYPAPTLQMSGPDWHARATAVASRRPEGSDMRREAGIVAGGGAQR